MDEPRQERDATRRDGRRDGAAKAGRARLWVRLARWAALLLVLLLAGLTVAVFAASRYVGTPEFRTRVEGLLSDAAGVQVHIQGGLDVAVFPWLGLEATDIRVEQPQGFAPPAMLHAARVVAAVRVLPLLDRRLVMDTILVDGAEVYLQVEADGRANWEVLAAADAPGDSADGTGAMDAVLGDFLDGLEIHGLRLDSCHVRYVDRQSDADVELADVSLRTGRFSPGVAMPYELRATLRDETLGLALAARLSGEAATDWKSVRVGPVEVDAQAELAALPEGVGPLRFFGRVQPDLDTPALSVDDARVGLADAVCRLRGRVDLSGEAPKADGSIDLPAFDAGKLLRLLAADVFDERSAALFASTAAGADFAYADDVLHLSDLRLAAAGTSARGRATLHGLPNLRDLDLSLDLARVDLEAIVDAFADDDPTLLVLDDCAPDLLRSLHATAELRLQGVDGWGLSVQNATLALGADAGDINLDLRAAGLLGGDVEGSAALHLDRAEAQGAAEGSMAAGRHLVGLHVAGRFQGLDMNQALVLAEANATIAGVLDGSFDATLPEAALAPDTPLERMARSARCNLEATSADAALVLPGEDGDSRRLVLESGSLRAQAAPRQGSAAGQAWPVALTVDATAELAEPQCTMQARLDGPVDLTLDAATLHVRAADVSAVLQGWFLPPGSGEAVVSGSMDWDGPNQALRLEGARASAMGVTVTGRGEARGLLDEEPVATAHLRTENANLRPVLARLDIRPDTKDPEALARCSAEADVRVDAGTLAVRNLSGMLDGQKVAGELSVDHAGAGRLTFRLDTGPLDLDRYLPPEEAEAEPGSETPTPLPLDTLRALDLKGDVSCERLRVWGLTLDALAATIEAADGHVQVRPFSAKLYGGRVNGGLTLAVGAQRLDASLGVDANAFDAGPFFKDLLGKEYVRGPANVFAKLTASGATDDDLSRTLAGQCGYRMADGSYDFTSQGGRTEYEQASAIFEVKDGWFSTEDMHLESSMVTARGHGRFSIHADSIALDIDASTAATPDIPIRIHGKLSDPEVSVSGGEMLKNAAYGVLGLPQKGFRFLRDLFF